MIPSTSNFELCLILYAMWSLWLFVPTLLVHTMLAGALFKKIESGFPGLECTSIANVWLRRALDALFITALSAAVRFF